MWQALLEDLKDAPFTVVAVAMDSRPDAARPWIEQGKPAYPCLIDREHRVADLYNMVNVPQAVWIDEGGRIVRPPESAGTYDAVRSRDPATGALPPEIAAKVQQAKRHYAEAVKDWARKGAASEHALPPHQATAAVAVPDKTTARAHAAFRLGQHLLQAGKAAEGDRFLAIASDLHPDSWNMWRQRAEVDHRGLAAKADFWARVRALTKPYYPAPRIKGMPE